MNDIENKINYLENQIVKLKLQILEYIDDIKISLECNKDYYKILYYFKDCFDDFDTEVELKLNNVLKQIQKTNKLISKLDEEYK